MQFLFLFPDNSKISTFLKGILNEKGYIYQGKYEGWYCTADETFVAEDQTKVVNSNGKEQRVSAESNRPVEWCSEVNYMFKLSKCRDDLIKWVSSGNFHCIQSSSLLFPASFIIY